MKIVTLIAAIIFLTTTPINSMKRTDAEQIIHEQRERINVPGFIPEKAIILLPEQKHLDDLRCKFVLSESLQETEMAELMKAEGRLGSLLVLKKYIGNQTLTQDEETEVQKWVETIAQRYKR